MDEIAPHQHRWMMVSDPPAVDKNGLYSPMNVHVMPNSSCDICGLTPEAVANEAAIKTLLAQNAQLREIVQVVAESRVVHAEIVDAWVLLLENQTISYNTALVDKARALLGKDT